MAQLEVQYHNHDLCFLELLLLFWPLKNGPYFALLTAFWLGALIPFFSWWAKLGPLAYGLPLKVEQPPLLEIRSSLEQQVSEFKTHAGAVAPK